jgi:hypothetical protein
MDKQPENQAYEVPLCERLDVVPLDTRLIIEDKSGLGTSFIPIGSLANKTAAELRRLYVDVHMRIKQQDALQHLHNLAVQERDRLHSQNQELVEALELYLAHASEPECAIWRHVQDKARAALEKHKEQA